MSILNLGIINIVEKMLEVEKAHLTRKWFREIGNLMRNEQYFQIFVASIKKIY